MEILGHEKIMRTLERSLEKQRLAHAYLFCGPEAVGKFQVAMWLAGRLSGQEAKVSDLDVLVIAPEIEEKNGTKKEREIKLEKIRELRSFLSLTSTGGKNKVAIIRGAQNLNLSAQNALLKILEEPPAHSTIILVAEADQKILPTVRSRCEVKRFHLLSDGELEKIVPKDLPNRAEVLFWSCGRPGWSKELVTQQGVLEERRLLLAEFRELLSMGLNERFSCAEILAKDVSALLVKLSFWLLLLREEFVFQKCALPLGPTKAFALAEHMAKSEETIRQTNANVRVVLENLFLFF